MKIKTELIVMLTDNDLTVKNAAELFRACRKTQVGCFGMKEQGLPVEEMKPLYQAMRACGKTTALEVVAYSEKEGMAGAELAAACGCDILMGTVFSDKIAAFCRTNHLKYMPFVGDVSGRPSVLRGTAESITAEANRCLENGAYGIDLLAYRYDGDADGLIRKTIPYINGPVCVAGSIGTYKQIDIVRNAGAQSFTVGSAFFDRMFGDTFPEQINNVYTYLEKAERNDAKGGCKND